MLVVATRQRQKTFYATFTSQRKKSFFDIKFKLSEKAIFVSLVYLSIVCLYIDQKCQINEKCSI